MHTVNNTCHPSLRYTHYIYIHPEVKSSYSHNYSWLMPCPANLRAILPRSLFSSTHSRFFKSSSFSRAPFLFFFSFFFVFISVFCPSHTCPSCFCLHAHIQQTLAIHLSARSFPSYIHTMHDQTRALSRTFTHLTCTHTKVRWEDTRGKHSNLSDMRRMCCWLLAAESTTG